MVNSIHGNGQISVHILDHILLLEDNHIKQLISCDFCCCFIVPSGYLTWPWKDPPFFIGKPLNLYKWAISHGYVSHNQRVSGNTPSQLRSPNPPATSRQTHKRRVSRCAASPDGSDTTTRRTVVKLVKAR